MRAHPDAGPILAWAKTGLHWTGHGCYGTLSSEPMFGAPERSKTGARPPAQSLLPVIVLRHHPVSGTNCSPTGLLAAAWDFTASCSRQLDFFITVARHARIFCMILFALFLFLRRTGGERGRKMDILISAWHPQRQDRCLQDTQESLSPPPWLSG